MKKLIFIAVILAFALGCEEVKETTVSGTVTNGAAGSVSGAIVLLVEADSLEAGMSLSGGSVTLTDGSYEIIRVDAGSYYVPAIKDENSNATFDSLDLFGFYGAESTWSYFDTTAQETVTMTITIPEQITVTEGVDQTDIDIDTLYVYPLQQ